MDNKKKIQWTTRTAVFVALLIVMQAATAPLGNTLVTGTIVNLLLIISVVSCGPASGLIVAVISPVMAKLFGIGPLWSLIPFIMAGNAVLTLVWHFVGRIKTDRVYIARAAALICAAAAKFSVLYIGIVRIAVPLILDLPEKQASVISATFSLPQLITASTGGVLAFILLPVFEKAVGERWR